MSMVPQPYPLYVVWDETTDAARTSHAELVIGWRELPDPKAWRPPGVLGPYPVVIHPETQLPVTLGYDGPASVSRMTMTDDPQYAEIWRDRRERAHKGQR